MKRFPRRCQHSRQEISLLASGAVSKDEAAKIEAHLAECAECRSHFAEIRAVVTPLTAWEKYFAHIEPRTTVRSVLSKATTAHSEPKSSLTPQAVLAVCWKQLILPNRRIWAGLAAVWLGVFVANHAINSDAPKMVVAHSTRSADCILTFREQERVLAELILRPDDPAIEPPKKFVPRPRSEAHLEFLLA